MDPADCIKATDCGNRDIYCDMCVAFSFYKKGHSRNKGMRHEKKVAQKRNQATLRKGSGAVATAKGDVIDDMILHEAKSGYATKNSKGKKTFTIDRDWLLKIKTEAYVEARLPILQIHFDQAPEDEIWSVIDADLLFEILDELKTLRNKTNST